jgi:hypothetical protein
MTHITDKTSMKIKGFLGDNAPTPLNCEYWVRVGRKGYMEKNTIEPTGYPLYQLHDLLSKPFCEAMGDRVYPSNPRECKGRKVNNYLVLHYWEGGLPAVEKALLEMMEAK